MNAFNVLCAKFLWLDPSHLFLLKLHHYCDLWVINSSVFRNYVLHVIKQSIYAVISDNYKLINFVVNWIIGHSKLLRSVLRIHMLCIICGQMGSKSRLRGRTSHHTFSLRSTRRTFVHALRSTTPHVHCRQCPRHRLPSRCLPPYHPAPPRANPRRPHSVGVRQRSETSTDPMRSSSANQKRSTTMHTPLCFRFLPTLHQAHPEMVNDKRQSTRPTPVSDWTAHCLEWRHLPRLRPLRFHAPSTDREILLPVSRRPICHGHIWPDPPRWRWWRWRRRLPFSVDGCRVLRAITMLVMMLVDSAVREEQTPASGQWRHCTQPQQRRLLPKWLPAAIKVCLSLIFTDTASVNAGYLGVRLDFCVFFYCIMIE